MRLPLACAVSLLLSTPIFGLTIANRMPQHPNNNIKVLFCGTETIIEPANFLEFTVPVTDPFRWEETLTITYYDAVTRLPMTYVTPIADWDLENHIVVTRCNTLALIEILPHRAYVKFKKGVAWDTFHYLP